MYLDMFIILVKYKIFIKIFIKYNSNYTKYTKYNDKNL